MLGYSVQTRSARRNASPATLALIVGGHAALILAVMNSRIDVQTRPRDPPIIVDTIKPPQDPLPMPPEPRQPDTIVPREVPIDRVPPLIPVPDLRPSDPYVPLPSPIPNPGPLLIPVPDVPKAAVRVGPKAATPQYALRPPYPEAKRRLGDEAVLRLRLTIDERGRVSSVDPLGVADPMFLASARSHLIRHWRYRPATEGGRAVASSIIITLRFKLDEI